MSHVNSRQGKETAMRGSTSGFIGVLVLSLAAMLWASPAGAGVVYWDGTSESWNTIANWSTASGATTPDPLAVPGASDDVIFNITTVNGAEVITLDADQAARSLTFNHTDTTALTGGGTARTLTLGAGGITIDSTAGAVTLGDGTAGNDVLINLASGAQTWTNNSASAFTINNSAATFTRSAGATLTFNQAGAGVFAMSTTVLPNVNSIIGPWAFFGTGSNTKYAYNNSGTIAGLTGTAAANGAGLIDTAGTVNYDLAAGGGTVPVTMSANTIRYTGTVGTTAPGATLFSVNGLMNAGTGLWTIGTNAVTIGATKELVVNTANNSITISGIIKPNAGGVSSITKIGAGTLSLSNAASTYTGATIISAGILDATTFAAINTNSSIGKGSVAGSAADLVLNGGTLKHSAANVATTNRLFSVGTAGGTIDSSASSATNTLSFTGTGALGFNGQIGTRTLTLGGSNTGSNTMALLIGNDGSGNATSLTKTGAGTWILSNASNSYTGPTTISAGTLSVSATGNLGAAASNLVFNGGTLQITGTTLTNFSGIGHTVSFTSGQTVGLDINNASNVFTADQVLNQGAGGLTKLGAGTLVLSQTNTYSGTTTISAGTLIPASAASLPGYDSASKVVFSGGTLQLLVGGSGWTTGQVDTLLSNAVKTSGALGIDYTEGNLAQWTSFNILGAVGLTKLGTNTLTLDQANTYTGATTLSAGTLNLSNQNAVQNSTLTMGGGSLMFDSSVVGTAFTFGGLAAASAGAGYDIALQNNAGTPAAIALTIGGNDASTTYAAVLSGTDGSLTKTGAGTLTLSGANTYTGATNITEGTLTISNAATFSNTSQITLSGTGRLGVNVANQSLAKLVTGGGVPAGTFLQYSTAQATAGASNGPGTIFGTVELDLTNVNPNYTLDFGAGSILTNTKATVYTSPITLSGDATINATSGAFTGTGMTVGSTTAGAKTLTLTGTQTSSITGAISDGSGGGTIGLTKSGAGIWKLSGANTSTGPTNNTEHVLEYDNFSAIGNTSKITTTSSGSIYFNNGILNGQTITTPMEISGAHSYTFAQNTTGNAALIIWDGPTVTFNNTITLLASSAIHFFSGSLTANFNGTITGTGDMTFSIGGAAQNHNVYVVLNSGSSLTYSGNTIVTTFGNGNATVKLNGGYLPSTLLHLKDNYYSSTFNNTAVFDLNGKSQTLSGLTDTAEAGGGGRFVVNTSGTQSILTIDGTTSQTFAGVIGVNSAASAHGQTAGAGNIALVKAGSGTQTLSGANTYTGATTINGGTLSISGAAGTIKTSTAINLNGGGLTLTNATAEIAVDRVKNDAAITSNGGTITWTNASGNSIVYAETVGSVALTSGQLNLVESTNQAGTGTSSQTLTIGTGGITHTDSTNTSAVTFSAATTGPQLSGSKNMIVVTGGGTTNASEIIGPWATVGTTAALQTDYAICTSDYVTGCGTGATTSDSTWSTTYAATSNYNFANDTTGTTLTATRNINTLRHTGGAETLTVATGANLGTYGILNGVASALTIAATDSGAVTLPTTSADKLYVTTGSGAITISAPIQNNDDGALTLVKSGSGGTLTLSGNNTYTGGTVVNAGTIAAGSTTAFGTNAAMTLANFAGTVLNITGYNNSIGSLTGGGVNGGNVTLGAATLTVGGDGTSPPAYAGVISGTGALTKTGAGTLTLSGKNTYTGDTKVEAGTLSITQAYLANAADVYLTTGATFNLNFVGTDIIDELRIDSFLQLAGTWGAPGSGAAYVSNLLSGTGWLDVKTGLTIMPGDTNEDKVVDAFDFITLKKNFGKSSGATQADGDFNTSGTVNWADLSILMNHMGPASPATSVPEPCSAMLLVFGAAAMLRRRRA